MTTRRIRKTDPKFGELLRYYRRSLSLTQRQLYDELEDSGCDYSEKHGASLISRYETGGRKPPKDTIESLERILDVPDDLLLKAAGYTLVAPAPDTEQGEAEHKLGEETSPEQQAEERRRRAALIPKWRRELATFAPVQLLQEWLIKTHEDARTRFYANEDVEMLYYEARKPHPLQLRPFLRVENDPTFGLLRQRFPASNVWVAFRSWCEQQIPYVSAFYRLLTETERVAANAVDAVAAEGQRQGIKGVDWVDDDGFPGFAKRCRMKRLLTVLVICDLLARGIASLPSNAYWAHLVNGLEKLRLTVNLELSAVTGITPKGGWSSGIMDVRVELPDHPLELTEEFLDELTKLRLKEDSLVKALKELESQI